MRKPPENLIDLAASAGPPPEGVALTTWLIASLPPGDLTRAARYRTPSYEDLVRDKAEGGKLLKHMDENPMPQASLGKDILNKQQELSTIRRRLAVTACSLTLLVGGTAYGYESLTSTDKDLGVKSSTADRIERAAILGVPAGLLGYFVTTFVALGQAGRLARRPAERIVLRARQETQE